MDLHASRGHSPVRRRFAKQSVKGQLAALEQQVSVLHLNHGTNARTTQHATQSHAPTPARSSNSSGNMNNHNNPALTHQHA